MKIAIDGPAGSGKSTIAKRIAQVLDFTYIDTGAMYRAITYFFITKKVSALDSTAIESMLNQIDLNFENNKMFLNGQDISVEIRTPEVTLNVSDFSKVKSIRDKMQVYQRSIAQNKAVVMDGRDIGTVVLYDAELKIFLTATVEERARRRLKDLKDSGFDSSLEDLIQEIERRDQIDSTRDNSPLKKADDAIEIDTSSLSINQVVELILQHVKEVKNVSFS